MFKYLLRFLQCPAKCPRPCYDPITKCQAPSASSVTHQPLPPPPLSCGQSPQRPFLAALKSSTLNKPTSSLTKISHISSLKPLGHLGVPQYRGTKPLRFAASICPCSACSYQALNLACLNGPTASASLALARCELDGLYFVSGVPSTATKAVGESDAGSLSAASGAS